MTEFLRVITAAQFIQLLGRFERLGSETVPLAEARHRFLAADVVSPEDLPQRARSTVDGYAVRAEDTFGASESIPALLDLIGEVSIGRAPGLGIGRGQAAYIPTGGCVPVGSDAVVMVEYTGKAGEAAVEVTRPVTAKANVTQQGEDVGAGTTAVVAGRMVRSSEIGLLAALGIRAVRVFRRPRVAVVSTGDEIVTIDQKPGPGQVRDANAHSVSALVRWLGATPIPYDIVPDQGSILRETLERALPTADVVAVSGGSSVGTRDLVVDVVRSIPGVELLAHGVAIRPGKPTLLARRAGKAIFGLPGHPVSALLVAHVFLAPFLRYLQGAELKIGPTGERVTALLPISLHSTIGLQEFVRVRLEETPEGFVSHPVHGKSSMLSTMVQADGVVVIPMGTEGLESGEVVEVIRM